MVGLLGGVAASSFSRTLAFLFGLAVFGVQVRNTLDLLRASRLRYPLCQWMASHVYNIVPTSKIQRYVKGIDLRSAIEDNIAFKLSFGATFMLAAFAEF